MVDNEEADLHILCTNVAAFTKIELDSFFVFGLLLLLLLSSPRHQLGGLLSKAECRVLGAGC